MTINGANPNMIVAVNRHSVQFFKVSATSSYLFMY